MKYCRFRSVCKLSITNFSIKTETNQSCYQSIVLLYYREKHWRCHQKPQERSKRQRWQEKSRVETAKEREVDEERKVTLSTSTKFWNKFIQTPEYPAKPWAFWTRSSTTSSSELQPSLLDSPTTTKSLQSALAKFRPPFDCFCPVNWRNTRSVKEQKPLQSTPAQSKAIWKILDYTRED